MIRMQRLEECAYALLKWMNGWAFAMLKMEWLTRLVSERQMSI